MDDNELMNTYAVFILEEHAFWSNSWYTQMYSANGGNHIDKDFFVSDRSVDAGQYVYVRYRLLEELGIEPKDLGIER